MALVEQSGHVQELPSGHREPIPLPTLSPWCSCVWFLVACNYRTCPPDEGQVPELRGRLRHVVSASWGLMPGREDKH